MITIDPNFQTPPVVCNYMASFLPKCGLHILEPTPGLGQLVKVLANYGTVHYPANDFWKMKHKVKYDYAVMNPPFTPMAHAYKYLTAVMGLTDNIVALVPWLVLINSSKRMDAIKQFGLVSVTHLPRKTFPNSRVQCCIIQIRKGHQSETIFKTFNF